MFTDDDTLAPPDWLENLVAPLFLRKEVAAVTGQTLPLKLETEAGAFTYHLLSVQRNASRLQLQPLSFYADLLLIPWRTERGWNAWASAILLGLSQAANAAGYLYETSQHSMRCRKTSGRPEHPRQLPCSPEFRP